MSCRAVPWGRPSAPRGRPFPASARLRGPFGGMNAWKNPILKNSWRIGHVPAMFGLPSGLFRCMASSGSGDGGFSRPQSIDEAPMPLYPWPDKQRPRVCILGGGFGGLYTALRLESLVWPGNNKPQVMLVDQSDRFVFKPMLYELLSGEVDVWEIAPYFTELLKNTSVQFVKDSVKLLRPSDHLKREPGVSCTGGVVHLESGTVVEYDWLVLALGAEAKIDVVPGSAEYALPFTTLEHALKVESELKMLERRRFGKTSPPIQVAIVGLGYSGVELAATISERLKNTGTVKAINFQTTICPNAPPGNREAALKVLESQNIQLFLGYSVNSIRKVYASEDSGSMVADVKEAGGDDKKLVLELQAAQRGLQSQVLEADLVLWTVGSQSQILRLQPPDAPYVIPLNGRGQVETEETLQVKGHPRTFAIGDSAALRDPSGKFLPANAQVAFQQADFAGWNIWAAINDRPLLPFRFQNLGEMMTLGRNDAAITANFIEGLTLEGPIGHAARKLVYCLRMPTDEHRVKVGISWFAKGAVDSLASLQNAVASALQPPTPTAPPTAATNRCAMDPDSEIAFDFPPYICQYKSGRVHRPGGDAFAPAGTDLLTGVVSKDVHAGPARARVYLPPDASASASPATGKLPVVIYFHGGGFVVGSPARPSTHAYLNDLVARSGAVGVSVYYRLAPEHMLPAAYDDGWAAVRWAVTRGGDGDEADPWLLDHADLSRVFLSGCSAGANIAHNMAVRAAAPGALPEGVALRGLMAVHPYFTGKEAVGAEAAFGPDVRDFMDRTWRFVFPGSLGLDDPNVNPFVTDEARAAVARIPCERVLVCLAEDDVLLKERGLWYARELKASGYAGEIEMFESKGVGHAFHFDQLGSGEGVKLQERLVDFIKK